MGQFFVIILIGVGMWVLQYIFREPEDEQPTQNRTQPRRPGQRRPPVTPRTEGDRPRRAPSDLDRFLAEARARRQDREPEPVVEAELVREEPPPLRDRPIEEKKKPAPPPPVRRPKPTPTRKPAQPEPVMLTVVEEPVMEPVSGELASREVEPLELTSPSQASTEQASPALDRVAELLSKKDGFKAAVVLHEILTAPLSMRSPGKRPVDR